jgi:hypothetical protein
MSTLAWVVVIAAFGAIAIGCSLIGLGGMVP